VEKHLARAGNVRAALAFVARGEAPLGIVYRTDALAEPKVRIVDTFPRAVHAPIVYPAALLEPVTSPARELHRFLTSAEARAIWSRHGFREPG
jgi:molybdate transport system substrate-binding protein